MRITNLTKDLRNKKRIISFCFLISRNILKFVFLVLAIKRER